jgi:hypothetical protein
MRIRNRFTAQLHSTMMLNAKTKGVPGGIGGDKEEVRSVMVACDQTITITPIARTCIEPAKAAKTARRPDG